MVRLVKMQRSVVRGMSIDDAGDLGEDTEGCCGEDEGEAEDEVTTSNTAIEPLSNPTANKF